MLSSIVTSFCMAALVTGDTEPRSWEPPVRPSSQAAAASESLRVGELQDCIGSLKAFNGKGDVKELAK